MTAAADIWKREEWTTLREAEAVAGRLWREREAEGQANAAPGGTRLRSLNLVAVAFGRREGERIEEVFHALLLGQPARLILLEERTGPDVGSPLPLQGPEAEAVKTGGEVGSSPEVRVGLACVGAEGRHETCSDMFLVPALAEDAPRLHVFVEPLLLPDLPVMLWMPQEPDCSAQDFRRLTQVAQRVVLDSAGFTDPALGLKLLHRQAREQGAPAFGDLSWGRLTPWRELVADLFQDEGRRPLLQRITRVAVEYGSEAVPTLLAIDGGRQGPPALARALLFLGWLGSRLGWRPAGGGWEPSGEGVTLQMGRPDKAGAAAGIAVSMAPHRCSHGTYGGLETVTLEAVPEAEDGRRVVLTIKRSPETGICASRLGLQGAEVEIRAVDMPAAKEPVLLAQEIAYRGRDAIFQESLALAAELGGLSGANGLWV